MLVLRGEGVKNKRNMLLNKRYLYYDILYNIQARVIVNSVYK